MKRWVDMMHILSNKISLPTKAIYKLPEVEKRKFRTASERISYIFLDLLEQQFPVTDKRNTIELRYASQFADELNIHVNHLNRVLKETLCKTTTQIISERILYEAKNLLVLNNWRISEIAYALGFGETTHFNNFFKKRSQMSPTRFRKRSL